MHQQIKPVQKAPITTVNTNPLERSANLNYLAAFINNYWCIKTIKHEIIANNDPASALPSFEVPATWDTRIFQLVELKMQEGCANSKCEWTCNGCTAKTTMVDTTNNLVTILKYI